MPEPKIKTVGETRPQYAKRENTRRRNIARAYASSAPTISNIIGAIGNWIDSIEGFGGESHVYGKPALNVAVRSPTNIYRTVKNATKTYKTVKDFITEANIERNNPITTGFFKLSKFFRSPAYKKRLQDYYKAKNSSIVTQNTMPDKRIEEQLRNIEDATVQFTKPQGIIGGNGKAYENALGVYEPLPHHIQLTTEGVFKDTPMHEMIHARNKGKAFLDNAKYKMRVKPNLSTEEAAYYGDVVEQEPRVLNTLAAMERQGYDINNLSDEQIYKYLYDRPIDMHGSDTQSLIDNYVMEDIPRALRNFKNVAIPVVAGWTSYNIGKRSLESGGK